MTNPEHIAHIKQPLSTESLPLPLGIDRSAPKEFTLGDAVEKPRTQPEISPKSGPLTQTGRIFPEYGKLYPARRSSVVAEHAATGDEAHIHLNPDNEEE